MPIFAKPATQAAKIMMRMQGDQLRSVGTVRNYEQGLTRAAEWARANSINGHSGLASMTREQAIEYLTERAEQVS